MAWPWSPLCEWTRLHKTHEHMYPESPWLWVFPSHSLPWYYGKLLLGQRLCVMYLYICSIYETVQGHSRCLILELNGKWRPWTQAKSEAYMKNEIVSMCLILCTPFPFLLSDSLMRMLTKYDPNLIPVRQMPHWLAVGIPGAALCSDHLQSFCR